MYEQLVTVGSLVFTVQFFIASSFLGIPSFSAFTVWQLTTLIKYLSMVDTACLWADIARWLGNATARVVHYSPRMWKATSLSSHLFRSQEAEWNLLCETVNSRWQWTRSKHHVRVPKPRGSYYLVNNSVRSDNHTMSVTLNLGAVGIIQPAGKTRSHSVSQAIIFTSLLTELFDSYYLN